MAYFNYLKDTLQEVHVQTFNVTSSQVQEVKVFLNTLQIASNCSATQTTIPFKNLNGNIPTSGFFYCGNEKIRYSDVYFSSGTTGEFRYCTRGFEKTTATTHNANDYIYIAPAYAFLNQSITNSSTNIPFISLDRPGTPYGQLSPNGVIFIENEAIFYNGITYTNTQKTAGLFKNCIRGYNNTTAAAHNGSTTPILIRFEYEFLDREIVTIYNNTNETLYYGFTYNIDSNGTNALSLAANSSITIPLGYRNRLYVIGSENYSGTVSIVEGR